jgi:hypothetical protein
MWADKEVPVEDDRSRDGGAADLPTAAKGDAEEVAPDEVLEALRQSRSETRAAFENRALMYYHLFNVLSEELGREQAIELMKRAIHRRGLEVGRKYQPAGQAGDLDEVGRLFCSGSPCAGALFEPGIELREGDSIVLRMTACPLVDAWSSAGASAEEVDTLCEIAAAVDEGTFDSAGLDLVFLDRLGRPDSTRCLLKLSPRDG